jgi:hypothetical protein
MFRRIPFALALVLGLSLHDAQAKKTSDDAAATETKEIEPTGVKEFDAVFEKVKAIHVDLAAMETKIASSRTDVATALGLAKDTSFTDSFAELKKRGEGKLSVALDDRKLPTLKAEDAAPDDVKTAASKVNASTDALVSAKERVPSIKDNSLALKDEVADFPSKVDKDLLKKNDLSVTSLPKVLTKTKSAVGVTASTPARVEAVGQEIEDYFTSLRTAFTGGSAAATAATTTTTTTTETTTTETTTATKPQVGEKNERGETVTSTRTMGGGKK